MSRTALPARLAALSALAVVILVSAACETTGLELVDCGGIYDGACSTQADAIALRWPDRVRNVALSCDLPDCDRHQGAGHALVTFVDGSTTTTVWQYENPAPELPDPTCIGLDRELCQLAYANVVVGVPPEWQLADVAIRCDGDCEPSIGDTTVTLTMADGTTHMQGFGWEGGMGMPSPWVGVPLP